MHRFAPLARSSHGFLALAFAAVLAAAGCASETTPDEGNGSTVPDTTSDVVTGDTSGSGDSVGVTDAGSTAKDAGSAAKDAGSSAQDAGSTAKDAGSTGKDAGSTANDAAVATNDGSGADAGAGADAGSGDAGGGVDAGCDGKKGCSCENDGDCKVGPCVQIGGNKVCVDAADINCAPCSSNNDCLVPGTDNEACVKLGTVGSFCAQSCKADADCPKDYACMDAEDVDGAKAKWCQPKAKDCKACTDWAVVKGGQTTCSVTGKLGGKDITCKAPRKCTKDGKLPACSAKAPAVDKCDGLDNDCNGKADDGQDCDDKNACTTDVCEGGTGCAHKNNVLPCDDGNVCTDKDQCKGGKCTAGAAKVCDDKNACTNDKCDAKKGCVHLAIAATACDDGNACTADSCDKTKGCVNADATKAKCDDKNACTTDTCDKKKGCQHTNNTAPCDDGSKCTVKESCKGGKCVGTKQNCNDGNSCTANACDPKKGCQAAPLPDGSTCTDNNPCTLGDGCVKGQCKPAKGSKCDDKNPCTTESCDAKGGCKFTNNKAQCSDGSVCTSEDRCKDGKCTGEGKICKDGIQCTKDDCDPKTGCTFTYAEIACEDGDKCTVGDKCQITPDKKATCKPGIPNPCDDGNPCTDGKCTNGACKLTLKTCDDKLACTIDKCDFKSGKCINQFTDKCKDITLKAPYKTTFACSDPYNFAWQVLSDAGPRWSFDNSPNPPGAYKDKCSLNFNDGKNYACPGNKPKKSGSVGVEGTVISPRFDLSAFKKDWPIAVKARVNGQWESSHSRERLSFAVSWDDGKTWKTLGVINGGKKTTWPLLTVPLKASAKSIRVRLHFWTKDCIANAYVGPFIDDFEIVDTGCKDDKGCNDGSPCTEDKCNTTTGVCSYKKAAVGAGCSDGNACTSKDACDAAGKCVGVKTTCNDFKTCTTDSCDAKTGKCVFLPKAKGSYCYSYCAGSGSKCDGAGACVGEKPKTDGTTCTHSNNAFRCKVSQCSKGQCKVTTANKSDGSYCSDYNGCTTSDKCAKGQCVGKADTAKCDDKNACTLDTCSPRAGSTYLTDCKHVPVKDGTKCVDGDPCTTADLCTKGVCKGIDKCTHTVAFNETFKCEDKGKGWTINPKPASGKPGWGVDGTPNPPGFRSKACSLNYNDGKSYPGKTAGVATSGDIKVPAAGANLTFWQFHGMESSNLGDHRKVLVSADNFTSGYSKTFNNANDRNKWSKVTVDLAQFKGKTVKLRFDFDSKDTFANSTAGWFIDDIRVGSSTFPAKIPCKIDYECPQDSDKCTAPKCISGTCGFAPVPGCNIIKKTLPYKTSFDCGGAAGKEWKFDNQSKGATWTVDSSPNPPAFKSASCSLNYNDGTNYRCQNNEKLSSQIGVQGYVASPVMDGAKLGKDAKVRMRFMLGGGWSNGTSYNLDLEISTDGGQSWKMVKTFDKSNKNGWLPTQVELPTAAGKLFQVRFRFYTTFCTGINLPGPFIDDLSIFDAACTDAKKCDDGNVCTTDKCDTKAGVCVNTPVATPDKCDDGNKCTLGDVCKGGSCEGKQKVCQDGNPCTIPSCSAGNCVFKPRPTTHLCTDGDTCTSIDKCDGKGKCVGGNLKSDGTKCTKGDICTLDGACSAGKCVGKGDPKKKGTLCNDLTSCTNAACDGKGKCVGVQKPCDDKNTCTKDACVNGAGCVFSMLADNATCDDGNPCTNKNHCWGGKCLGTNVADKTKCSDGDICSLNDLCMAGKCVGTAGADGIKCDDGKKCTIADLCAGGKCGGKTISCNDGESCTTDSCDEKTGACAYKPRAAGLYCTDYDSCTTGDKCDGAGKCKPGTAKSNGTTCYESEVCKKTKKCQDGKCIGSGDNATDNSSCTDNNTCTVGDLCKGGECVAGAPAKCDDKQNCTLDSCKKGAGCQYTPLKDGTLCKDGAACQAKTVCYGGKCVGEVKKDGEICNDGDQCTTDDKCAKGKCVGKNKPDYTKCDDGSVCTMADYCQAGTCKGATNYCNDNNECTTDSCDKSANKCVNKPKNEGAYCNDGNGCTTSDKCKSGKCVGTKKADGGSCYDLYCHTGEKCVDGKCEGGTPLKDDSYCNDNNPCTTKSWCKGGKCEADPAGAPACDDKNPCTLDKCHVGTKFAKGCSYAAMAEGAKCDDGNKCTESSCKAGTCTATKQLCTTAWTESFPCAKGLNGWAPNPLYSPTGFSWGVDGTPNPPGFKSKSCSLNANDGKGYNGYINKYVKVKSPLIKVPTGKSVVFTYWSFAGLDPKESMTSPFDYRRIYIYEGGIKKTFDRTKDAHDRSKWAQSAIDITGYAGKSVQFEFEFRASFGTNNGLGWFVDDLAIQVQK